LAIIRKKCCISIFFANGNSKQREKIFYIRHQVFRNSEHVVSIAISSIVMESYFSGAQVVNNKQCQDNLENCHLYGEFACKELPEWAAENCRLTCGICKNSK